MDLNLLILGRLAIKPSESEVRLMLFMKQIQTQTQTNPCVRS